MDIDHRLVSQASANTFPSTALAIYSLGVGLSLFVLSLLASATFEALDNTHTAHVFSIVGLLGTPGELVGTGVLSGI